MVQFLEAFGERAYHRNILPGHLTVSSWVVNKDRTKVLMAFHNIYQAWAWLGGHADGEQNLALVALREAEEESGIQSARLLSDEPFYLDVNSVVAHLKRGIYVPPHLHFNQTFLLEADENEPLKIKEDENSGVAWIEMDKLAEICNEPHILPIYQSIVTKLLERKI